jgi:hypothetical protein
MATKAVFVMFDETHAAYVGNQPLLEIVDGGAGKPGTRGTASDLFDITGESIEIDWTRYSDRETGRLVDVPPES